MMDIVNTGNTFIAYPEENMELDVWENGKLANLEAIGSPFCGFIYKNEENSAYLDEMAALYSHYMNRLDTTEVANDEEFELLIDEITAEVDELEAMQALNDVEDPLSPAALYIEWYNNTYAAG